jgi:seryl-tRNA synthetase
MHDIKAIRENAAAYDANWARRGLEAQTPRILEQDEVARGAAIVLQEGQAERNAKSKEIGIIKARGGDASALMEEVAHLKEDIAWEEGNAREAADALQKLLEGLPNLLDPDVPDGADEDDNAEVGCYIPPPRRGGSASDIPPPRRGGGQGGVTAAGGEYPPPPPIPPPRRGGG